MDIIERLNDPEMYVDAVDDAAREIETLRQRVAKLEAASRKAGLILATLCDMVLGENAEDRSDEALIRAVGKIVREFSLGGKTCNDERIRSWYAVFDLCLSLGMSPGGKTGEQAVLDFIRESRPNEYGTA